MIRGHARIWGCSASEPILSRVVNSDVAWNGPVVDGSHVITDGHFAMVSESSDNGSRTLRFEKKLQRCQCADASMPHVSKCQEDLLDCALLAKQHNGGACAMHIPLSELSL